jgi:hypothetical protein
MVGQIAIPPDYLDIFNKYASYLVLIAFVCLYVYAFYKSWSERHVPDAPRLRSEIVYVATLLAGLIGAIVSTALGQTIAKLPSQPPPGIQVPEPDKKAGGPATGVEGVQSAAKKAATSSTGQVIEWKIQAVITYAAVYFIVGSTCIIIWLIVGTERTHEMIKNFAFIFLGFFLNVVRAALN